MKIAFRVDASSEMGVGHLMRCRTLAALLRAGGHQVRFVCRALPGNMIAFLRAEAYAVAELPAQNEPLVSSDVYVRWLGVPAVRDAEETGRVLSGEGTEWLVVDHYALGASWEQALRNHARHILAIDDLANREHECDLLLDQNLVDHSYGRYRGLLPAGCRQLLGPGYALVRPEFSKLRSESLGRHRQLGGRLLIFMGGADPGDDTGKVVKALSMADRTWKAADVVVGNAYPFKDILKAQMREAKNCRLHVQTNDMARLMASADLAVTAGGSVSWEKCCLGLPSLVVVQSENQVPIAAALQKLGAQENIGCSKDLSPRDYARDLDSVVQHDVECMGSKAAKVCDGSGALRIADIMENY